MSRLAQISIWKLPSAPIGNGKVEQIGIFLVLNCLLAPGLAWHQWFISALISHFSIWQRSRRHWAGIQRWPHHQSSCRKRQLTTANNDKVKCQQVGRVSLTDSRLSRINHFMAETLYDENIGGPQGNTHVAIGMAYRLSTRRKSKTNRSGLGSSWIQWLTRTHRYHQQHRTPNGHRHSHRWHSKRIYSDGNLLSDVSTYADGNFSSR